MLYHKLYILVMSPNNTQTPSIVAMIEQKTFALFLHGQH